MSIDKFIEKYCIQKDRLLKKICAPLVEKLSIPTFSYFYLSKEGHFGVLSNFPELIECYYGERMYQNNPYLVHPSFLQSGYVYTLTAPGDLNNSEKIFRKFQTFNILLMIRSIGEDAEGYIFSFRGSQGESGVEFYSKLEMIHAFIPYFKKKASSLIENMKAEKYNLKLVKGDAFFAHDSTLPLLSSEKEEFLKEIFPLTKRERQCLDLFKQGRSAQATAAILGLSRRTVEHYLDNIKIKLGCYSKWELLEY